MQPILGHERVVQFLEKALASDRLAHAYLFIGPERVGKTTVAEWLISRVIASASRSNLLQEIASSPANGGILAMTGHHPDVFVVNRLTDEKTRKTKQQISVEQVRELRERLAMSSFLGGRKVAFIEEADRLNDEAGNALLKTLEEPSKNSILILRASSTKQLLPTIISRCQVLRFTLVPTKMIEAGLRTRGVSQSEAHELANAAAGRPGQAMRLLTDSEERAREEAAASQLRALLDESLSGKLAMVGKVCPKEEADRLEVLTDTLNRWERGLREHMLGSLNTSGAARWAHAIEILQTVRRDLFSNINPTLALERLILTL